MVEQITDKAAMLAPAVKATVGSATEGQPVSRIPAQTTQDAAESAASAISLSMQEVKAATESLRQSISSVTPALKVDLDDALDAPIVTVTDRDTNELIRRIPSEDLISLARFVERQAADSEITAEKIKGVLLNELT